MIKTKLENAVLALCELYDESAKTQNWELIEKTVASLDSLSCSSANGELELARFYAKKNDRETAECHYQNYLDYIEDEENKDEEAYKEAKNYLA